MNSSTHYVAEIPKSKNMEDYSDLSSGAKLLETPEESSWTYYIQGFMCENECNNIDDDDDQNRASSSQHESPSLISDASSSAIFKKLTSADDNHHLGFSSGKSININNKALLYKQSSFKKQKTNFISTPSENNDLEDTASSPVNSPKISYMNQFMNQKEMAKLDVAKVKRNIFGKNGALT